MASWFRAYAETLNDRKVQGLSDYAFRTWHNLLYLACQIDTDDGTVGTFQDVSWALRAETDAFRGAIDELTAAGLIVSDETADETFRIKAWSKRQYKSDTSTDRVRAHRERVKRSETVTETPPDTEQKEQRERDARAKEFSEFWEAYPHKVAERKTEAVYIEVRENGTGHDVIMDGLKRYIANKRADREWLNPSSFLKDERWKDHPATPNGKVETPGGRATRLVDVDDPDWKRVASLYHEEHGKPPPIVNNGWRFPEEYFTRPAA